MLIALCITDMLFDNNEEESGTDITKKVKNVHTPCSETQLKKILKTYLHSKESFAQEKYELSRVLFKPNEHHQSIRNRLLAKIFEIMCLLVMEISRFEDYK